MAAYARGRAAMALGEGLRGLARLLAGQRESRAEQEERDTDRMIWLSERGGGLGPAPSRPKPAPAEVPAPAQMAPLSLSETMKPPPPLGARESRFAELPGERGHFLPSDVREREQAKGEGIQASAAQDRLRAVLRGLPHVPARSVEALVAGVPATVALPPRPTPARSEGSPRPTVNQAMEIVQGRYAQYDGPGRAFSGYGEKSYEEMYAEAVEMARGGGMRSAPLPTAPPVVVPPPPGRAGLPAVTPPRTAPPAAASADRAGPPAPRASPSAPADFQATLTRAQARARELQAQGKTRAEITDILMAEGFPVRRVR